MSATADRLLRRSDNPSKDAVDRAFAYCRELTRNHYENFPVASLFLPARLRPYVSSIYAFARIADDFADEGSLTSAERLNRLDDWEHKLDACFAGRPEGPVFIALAETMQHLHLPPKPFSDLLAAFRMDVTKKRYETYEALLQYCALSANPVGLLVLHLFGAVSDRNALFSDRICTALQLANFWQDVSVDWRKGRVYVPLEDLERFGYTENELSCRYYNGRFRELMEFEVDRTREMLGAGKPLLKEAPSNLRFELRLILLGGLAILGKIEDAGFDVLSRRPSLSLADKATCLGKAIFRYNV